MSQVGAVVHAWRTSDRPPIALLSSAAAGRDKTEPGQQLARRRTRAISSLSRTGTAPAMKCLQCWGQGRGPTSHAHPRTTRGQVRNLQSVQAYPGGGLHAKGGYQQEAGSSVLFEHCSANGTSAVEDVDEWPHFERHGPWCPTGLQGRQIEAEDL